MSKIFVSCLLLLVCGSTHAQENTFNKKAELQRFVVRGGKYEETAPNIYKLTYRTGETRVFNFNFAPKQTKRTEGVDTTIINVWEIDTLLYYHKFSFWKRVDLVNYFENTVPIADVNKNGLLELYGIARVNWPLGGQVDILEQDQQGIFHKVYSYDSTSLFVQGMGDVDSDGKMEIHLRTTDTLNGKFFRIDSLTGFPTNFDFIFYYTPNQIQDLTFGNYDDNKITDCAFVDASNPSGIIISEFRNITNNFDSVYQMITEGDDPGGTAIGDFDLDGKTELVYATSLQRILILETQGVNQYELIYDGIAPTYNAYMITQTKDIDKNRKPEFWIGGQDFGDGTSKIMCYETDDDNSYTPVAYIELRYLVSLYSNYLQAVDINNDSIEELIINLGNYLIMLKFTGSPNHHSYEIYYAKIKENTQPGSIILPSTIYDLNRDGKLDILLSLDLYNAPNISYILIQDTITSVLNENSQAYFSFNIHQNYPNPFNLITHFKIILSEQSNLKVVVYDVLGREISTLLDGYLSIGEHLIQWDGKNSRGNDTPGGIYFIQMKTAGFIKTIKTILLK